MLDEHEHADRSEGKVSIGVVAVGRTHAAASEAMALGHGGVSVVHRASRLSRKAIHKGIREIQAGTGPGEGRVRRTGGGRKPVTETDPELMDVLEAMIDEKTLGDPRSPLRWICMSTRAIGSRSWGQFSHCFIQCLRTIRPTVARCSP